MPSQILRATPEQARTTVTNGCGRACLRLRADDRLAAGRFDEPAGRERVCARGEDEGMCRRVCAQCAEIAPTRGSWRGELDLDDDRNDHWSSTMGLADPLPHDSSSNLLQLMGVADAIPA